MQIRFRQIPKEKDIDKLKIRREALVNSLPEYSDMTPEERLSIFNLHKYRYLEMLNLLPPEHKKLKILDVGCGQGFLTVLIKKWCNCDVYGLDIEVEEREHFRSEKIPVKACNVEKENFPFRDNFFDYVICNEIIEHLMFSPFQMLKEIHRVLKSGGMLILTTPNMATLIKRVRFMLGKNIYPPYSIHYKTPLHDRHNREYVMAEVKQLLLEHGFVINKAFYSNCFEKITPIGPEGYFPGVKGFRRRLYFLATQLYPPFRASMVIEASKKDHLL